MDVIRAIIALVVLLSANAAARDDSATAEAIDYVKNSPFCGRYFIVQERLFSGAGNFSDVLYLVYEDRKNAEHIFNFWATRAHLSMRKALEEKLNSTVSLMNSTRNKEEKERLLDSLQNSKDEAINSYYYDNWDAINKMITSAAERHKEKKQLEIDAKRKREIKQKIDALRKRNQRQATGQLIAQ